ncbi:MAG: PAS domain S-box protein [Gammaproteobacteria bacterium]|nr:PAS domain S-box protein [Gammaproteobacteria bacterium]
MSTPTAADGAGEPVRARARASVVDALARRLTDTQARLDGLVAALVDALVVIDEQGSIEMVNPAAERMFGYPAGELIGCNVKVLMPPPHRDEHDAYLARYRRSGEARIIGIGREVVAVRRDGSAFPADIAIGEVTLPDGRRFIGLIRDISRRVDAEQALRAREQELRLLFDYAPMAIIDCELAGTIRGANPAALELFGAATLTGCSLFRILGAADAATAADVLGRLGAGERHVPALEHRLARADGAELVVSAHYGLIPMPERSHRVVIHLVDRTEQLRAEREARGHRERLAHAGRLNSMGEMASGIAHEINQPLTAISAYARACQRLYESGRTGHPDFLDALVQIGAQAERAGEVIRRLRRFVHKRESRVERTDLREELAAVIQFAAVDTRTNETRIELRTPPALPAVSADAIQVQQVVLNLVRNAIEAMEGLPAADKAIIIDVAAAGPDFVEIGIADAGAGVDEALARNLFKPFFTTKATGMGLGLIISQSIIEAHGGRIWHTPNEPRGSVFRFTLPVALPA